MNGSTRCRAESAADNVQDEAACGVAVVLDEGRKLECFTQIADLNPIRHILFLKCIIVSYCAANFCEIPFFLVSHRWVIRHTRGHFGNTVLSLFTIVPETYSEIHKHQKNGAKYHVNYLVRMKLLE